MQKETGGTGNYEEKFISHVLTWADRKARCMSSMITGPANFPIARNAKANRSADNAWEEFTKWRTRYIKRATAIPTPSPEEDLDNAVKKLDRQIEAHQLMKDVNRVFRTKSLSLEEKFTKLKTDLECSDKLINDLRNPASYFGGKEVYGFESFSLTNSNARIKATKEKILTMKARIQRKATWEPIPFTGGSIDIQSDRVVIFHDEKPDQ